MLFCIFDISLSSALHKNIEIYVGKIISQESVSLCIDKINNSILYIHIQTFAKPT